MRIGRRAVAALLLAAIGCGGSPTAPDPILEPGPPYLVKDIDPFGVAARPN